MVRIYFDSRFGLTVHFEIESNHASSNIFPEKGIEEGFNSCCLIEIFNYISFQNVASSNLACNFFFLRKGNMIIGF